MFVFSSIVGGFENYVINLFDTNGREHDGSYLKLMCKNPLLIAPNIRFNRYKIQDQGPTKINLSLFCLKFLDFFLGTHESS